MHSITNAEFFGTRVSIIDHLGRRWLTARDVGRCLGYAEDKASQSINNLFARHADEFSSEDTCIIKLMTQGQGRDVRIFSQTGCILLAMFANTARAKDFRAWAKRVLAAALPAPVGRGTIPGRPRVTRAVERQVLELFVAGLSHGSIAQHMGISKPTVNQIIHGKYRFAPGAGEDETTPELIAAVAAEHAAREREYIVERFCASAANQQLVAALEATGQRLLAALDAAAEG
ncbi:MAG: BRO family protein [Tepidimonas taiwanensis]|nr:BRO family protein [Tepidimonas taiwanensis]